MRAAQVKGQTTKSPNNVDHHIGARIRARRLIIGMSQEKLGEALGVTFQQVQKYEKGTNRVGAGRLHQIGAILGVAVTYFYEGVEADSKAQAAGSREPSVATILETPEGFRLAKAFTAIQNREISRKVVELVEMVSEMQS